MRMVKTESIAKRIYAREVDRNARETCTRVGLSPPEKRYNPTKDWAMMREARDATKNSETGVKRVRGAL